MKNYIRKIAQAGGGQTYDLLVLVYFLFLMQRLKPLGKYVKKATW